MNYHPLGSSLSLSSPADALCSTQTRVEGVIEAAGASNVKLSQEELEEVREVINGTKIIGGRYNSHLEGALAR